LNVEILVIHRLILAAALSLGTLNLAHAQAAAAAPAVELAGVKYENTETVANTPLVLNGAGIRYKAIFKVYTAGLYLTKKANTPEAIIATPGPKRVHIVMLRDINASELGKLFTRGMEENAPRDEFSRSIPGTLALSDLFFEKKKLVAGDAFSVDWIPGTGTIIMINGKASTAPIKEPEFFTALLRIWLGKSPADSMLKDALMGIDPKSPKRGN
jgi:hypothetical protein